MYLYLVSTSKSKYLKVFLLNTHCNENFLISSLLSGYSRAVLLLCHWTQVMKGGTIAAEVLDASHSLRELCSKCGRNLTCGSLPLITCTGNCQPRRTFHSKCVPKSRRTDQDFKCLVCRPADREDFCFCCNGPATLDIILCGANASNGCQNFVHRLCVAKGRTEYRCGLC